jgi:pilus assembly protein CpaF
MKPANSSTRSSDQSKQEEFEAIKRRMHQRLVDKIDLSRVGDLKGESFRREIRLVVEHLCDSENTFLNTWSRSAGVSAQGPVDQRYLDQWSQEHFR